MGGLYVRPIKIGVIRKVSLYLSRACSISRLRQTRPSGNRQRRSCIGRQTRAITCLNRKSLFKGGRNPRSDCSIEGNLMPEGVASQPIQRLVAVGDLLA